MRKALFLLAMALPLLADAQRQETLLEKEWRFVNEEVTDAWRIDYDDSKWQKVTVPHDWAIYGPFDGNNDRQMVAVEQDGETEASGVAPIQVKAIMPISPCWPSKCQRPTRT